MGLPRRGLSPSPGGNKSVITAINYSLNVNWRFKDVLWRYDGHQTVDGDDGAEIKRKDSVGLQQTLSEVSQKGRRWL